MRSASAATSSARSRVKAIVAADTAGAAHEVAEAGDVSRAALATKLAAKIYGLQDPQEGRRRRQAQHHALCRSRAQAEVGKPQGARWSSRLSCSRCATSRPRCTRRWAVSPPTAST